MPPPPKPLKKDNGTDDCNKSVHEKWMEGYKYFWFWEGQEECNCTNEEGKAHVRKHREETGADIYEPILDVRSPYQMYPNSLVARAAEETKTKRDANLAVA
jgi:hypothetical protein